MATREMSYWKCERCKFINSNDDLNCYLCNIPRDEMSITGEWMCKKCSYTNSQTDDICILCETERELSILNSTLTTTATTDNQSLISNQSIILSFDWQCAICSFKNKSNTNRCIMCSYEKGESDEDLIVDFNDLNFRANSVVSRSISRVSKVNAPQSLSLIDKRAKPMVNTYMDATSHAERIWKNIVNYCKANRIKFVDDSFPPCNKSLFMKSKPKMVIHLGGHAIKWLSPEYIKTNYDGVNQLNQHHPLINNNSNNYMKNKDKEKEKENYESSDANKVVERKWTVYNNPKYSDIQQGLLGDCWLLSGLAVLIEKPEMLHKIIITKEYCPQGCYQVRLCHYGEWQTVIVDDLFPCDSNDLLIFSKANRRQLWIPLIEKAMAKLNGSYESLIAGRTVEGLSALTGYPCDSINLENLQPKVQEDVDLDMIWAKLLSIKEAGYAIAAPCGRTNNRDDYAFLQLGLIPYHAYSVINVKKVNGHQLIQLRNPWGMYSWLGDWSDKSEKWTPELRKQVGKHNDRGVFWMSFSDFTKYFSSIDICKTRLDLFENRIPGYFYYDGCNEMYAYSLIVFDTSEFDIGLFHKFNRNRRENSELDLSFVVLKKNKQKKDLIEGVEVATKRYVRKFMGCEHIFEAGEYLIVPMSFNFWTKTNSKKARSKYDLNQQMQKKVNPFNNIYNLVVHSTKEFYLEQKIYSKSLLSDTLIQLCLSKGERIPSNLKSACIYQLTNYWSGIVFVAENYDKKQYLHVELDLERSKNVVATRESFITKDSVPPLNRQVLNVISHLEGTKDFSIHYKIKYRLSINPNLIVWPGMSSRSKLQRNYPEINLETSNLHTPRSVFY